MALDIIPKALYPLVPQAPGVPPVLRGLANIADAATFGLLGLGDALDSLIGSAYPKWGIFDASGNPVAVADSVLSVDYNNGARVSDYPVEEGAFASYNKVANPWEARVSLTRGGSVADRSSFIDAIEQAAKSIDLYSIITPEVTYINANIIGWSYPRSASTGANKIIAEIYLREVRQSLTTAFIDTRNPASEDPASQGQVQGIEDSTVSLASVTA